MKIKKVVITGGPCSGKTAARERIKREFTEMGYSVLFIPETATELITGGIAPWTMRTPYDYQMMQIRLQIYKEKIFGESALILADKKDVIIVCDRGLIDNRAYMSEDEFVKAMAEVGLNEETILNSYDAVFHLSTIAGSDDYTLSNNEARTESAKEALMLDEKLASAWGKHPVFRFINCEKDFNKKLEILISEMKAVLG